MPYHTVIRYSTGFILTLAMAFASALPVQAGPLTQRDWMIALVDTLGWSYGLPDEPQDPDYINILNGNRAFRFEAEDSYARDEDPVTQMAFQNFGPFSGSGWLHGAQEPRPVQLRFTLPLAGHYRLEARLRGADHRFTVGGESVEVGAGDQFTDVLIGHFELSAGAQKIQIVLPANGSLDFIALSAPNLASLAPAEGWRPDDPLSWSEMQATLVTLFGLGDIFPLVGNPLVVEAEALRQDAAEVVSIGYLGSPSGGKWLRAGPLPVKINFPLQLPASGFYDLTIRAMGDPLQVTLGGHLALTRKAGPSLEDHSFGPLFLEARSSVTLELPPGGGVDQLILTRRQVDEAELARLLDLNTAVPPTPSALDTLTRQLAAFRIER